MCYNNFKYPYVVNRNDDVNINNFSINNINNMNFNENINFDEQKVENEWLHLFLVSSSLAIMYYIFYKIILFIRLI